ncbi:MAG: glycosyl transferase family 39, partial [Thermomicrobiales bacterium]|nr:glycosyl transferase family 39 [Thermomicrobiales bacterium]
MMMQQASLAPGGGADHASARSAGWALARLGAASWRGITRDAERVGPGHATWLGLAIPVVLALLALALSVPRLTSPNAYVFDELYYAYTAGRYVAGEVAYDTSVMPRDAPAIEWTHPPLAKLLIAGGILLAGDNPLGWRIASVLAGVAGVVITYVLALSLTGSRLTSALAAGLLLLDGLYLVESRTGMSNLFLLVFANGALLGLTRVLAAPAERAGPPLLATGAFLALAIATKWSAVALAGLIGLVVCWRMARLWCEARGAEASAARVGLRTYLIWAPVALIALPIGIYFASYLHFFLTGHGWADFIQLHRDMLSYHRELGTVHDDSSPWWQWPLAARGVWYYAVQQRGELAVVFGNGNPLLYWPMVVAVLWVAIDWWGRRPTALLILLLGFFGQWLPWALSPRGTFIYHLLPAVPLGCIALAVVVSSAWKSGGLARWAAAGYVVAVIATFAFFYPIYTAFPLDPDQVA